MHETILQSIGKTPLVKLRRMTEGLKAAVYVKNEAMNPGGSVKDRVAQSLIADAERRGWLRPGGTIIAATAGKTRGGGGMNAPCMGRRCVRVPPLQMVAEQSPLLDSYRTCRSITRSHTH